MNAANLEPADEVAAVISRGLATGPSLLGILAHLSSLYDPTAGRYEVSECCAHNLDQALRAAHERIFARWLLSPMAAQHADMATWLQHDCGDFERWLKMEQYRSLLPASAMEPERALFLCGIEAGLATLRNEHAPANRGRSKCLVRDILKFVGRDNTKNLKVFGREFGVSAETLGEAFHARTGLRFRKYARIARFLRAVPHLDSSQCSGKEASCLAGYSEPSTFVRDCRDLLGITPLELRQRLSALAEMTAAV